MTAERTFSSAKESRIESNFEDTSIASSSAVISFSLVTSGGGHFVTVISFSLFPSGGEISGDSSDSWQRSMMSAGVVLATGMLGTITAVAFAEDFSWALASSAASLLDGISLSSFGLRFLLFTFFDTTIGRAIPPPVLPSVPTIDFLFLVSPCEPIGTSLINGALTRCWGFGEVVTASFCVFLTAKSLATLSCSRKDKLAASTL